MAHPDHKKALIIGYVWPEPESSAAGRHMLSLITLLVSDGWQVHYASPAQAGEHRYDLSQLRVTEHAIALNCSSFDEFVTDMQPNLVVFDRFMMEEQFGWRVAKHCPDAIRVLDTEDLHFLRDARHKAVKQGKAISQADLHTDMAKREVASIFRSDLTLIISSAELNLLQTEFSVPDELLHHCPFMLPPAPSAADLVPLEARHHFISIGNFRHAPNWDAVLQLKQIIWPHIRRQLPDAELHVYGAYPPPKATQLHDPKTGFLVKGWANDAYEVLRRARVCLAPLRFGAGIKGKLTDAMLCGTPSVTTTVGAEGMIDNHADWPGKVEDDPAAFAQAAITLYNDAESWQQCRQRGLVLLKQRYDGAAIGSTLLQRISRVSETLQHHRRNNFIGAMLQHHHHKSTQYMAQWIEAKNRR